MRGYVALLLHAHLPFVRHPEHERFLEESWLYEAITESYLPLLRVFSGWHRDGVRGRITISLSPTLGAMLQDPLLRARYERYLEARIDLAENEVHRTLWMPDHHRLAAFYLQRFLELRESWREWDGDLVAVMKRLQEAGVIEVITTAATHAVLPLMSRHRSSIRGQILTARDEYQRCFGRSPQGIWLPECAYSAGLESVLKDAGFRWFVVDTHGLLNGVPRPRFGTFAPVFTADGVAAFGRDLESAQQVWSRQGGYPGDGRYRDFYRDVGFDLDLDYVRPAFASPEARGFTGIKYHRIATAAGGGKDVYQRSEALEAVGAHAAHFLSARREQVEQLAAVFGRAPVVVCPYDAELFGHWWYEGPEFLDQLLRSASGESGPMRWATPTEYLVENPTQQVSAPGDSSWGEEGYYRVWLNESNEWILPHLDVAMDRMQSLADRFPAPDEWTRRALNQAARELLLAQASDWPFILRTGTNSHYARQRITDHVLRFNELFEQIIHARIDKAWLDAVIAIDNLFPGVDYRSWSECPIAL